MDKKIEKEMYKAVKLGDLEIIRKLVSENQGLLDVITPFGTWLHLAARKGKNDVIQYLISQGMDVNQDGGVLGGNPIVSATSNNSLATVKLLHENGCIFDTSNSEKNPLFGAIIHGNIEIVKYMVENGIDITPSYPIGKYDAVDACRYAKLYGQTEIYEYLKAKYEEIYHTKYIEAEEKVVKFRRSITKISPEILEEYMYKAITSSWKRIDEKYGKDKIIKVSYELEFKSVDVNYRHSCNIYVQTEKNMLRQIEQKPEIEYAYRYEIVSWGLDEYDVKEFYDVQKYLLEHGMDYDKVINAKKNKEEKMEKYEAEMLKVQAILAKAVDRVRKEGGLTNSVGEPIYVYPFVTEDDHQKDVIQILKMMNAGLDESEYMDNIDSIISE